MNEDFIKEIEEFTKNNELFKKENFWIIILSLILNAGKKGDE